MKTYKFKMKAIILAGGFGTRLKSVVSDTPKSMALIAGKPFLEHQLHYLKEQNIEDIILGVHYMANKIKSYFRNGSRFGVDLTYSEEEVPLGTAGAVKNAEKYIHDTFFVLNGDSYSKVNLGKFLNFHKEMKNDATISLTKSEDSSDYGHVILEGNKIKEFSEKASSKGGLINSGVYIFEPSVFEFIESGKKVSLEKEIFPKLATEGGLGGYLYEGYFMDIGKPETYEQFRKDILKTLMINKQCSVRDAMQTITKTGIDLILVNDKEGRLSGVINNRIIREYLLKGGGLEDRLTASMVSDPIVAKTSDNDAKIAELFMLGINHLPILNKQGSVYDVKFKVEELEENIFPAVQGKAPLRISFAGGGTDLPYFFEKHGGAVINSTINKYCHATAIKRADSKIIISPDLGKEEIMDSKQLEYDGNFNLIKAVVNIMNPDFGFELYTHNDLPFGRGLGSSASLGVLVAKLIGELQGIKYSDDKLAKIAFQAESEELGIKGGWQDQYAAATGGFSFMEFSQDKTIIYPLRLKEDIVNEFNSHLLLCYAGRGHFSGNYHEKQEQSFVENEGEITARLDNLKKYAIEVKDCLLMGNLDRIGELLHEGWENKRNVSGAISNPKIDKLYEAGIKNGAQGGKLLGAGGGGYILFYYSPKERNQLRQALEDIEGEIMDFNFEFEGTKVWKTGV